MGLPKILRASVRHIFTHSPQAVHVSRSITILLPPAEIAPAGHAVMQRPQLLQRTALWETSWRYPFPSGFAHQGQSRGQPFKNTMVRIPGPSWTEYRWMLNTRALSKYMLSVTPIFLLCCPYGQIKNNHYLLVPI